ncbi:MAG: hypothetical protein JO102_01275, partial [Elusimicrobia bacterium]|nr:hypothetical protein [Elusimicrobiota bacterium]
MTIRQQFIRRTVISLAALAVGLSALMVTAQKPSRFMKRTQATGKLIRLLGSQIVFSGEYASTQGERPLRQWHYADDQIEQAFSEIQGTVRTPEERQVLSSARWHYARAEYLFDQLRRTVENRHPPEPLMPARAQ